MLSNLSIRALWCRGFDTMQISEIKGIPEAFVLKAITVQRAAPAPYQNEWPLTREKDWKRVLEARRSGIYEHNIQK